ncbi:hypothetical protein Q5424_26815 [Conexibacter sp. JD483]|uniref:hypothetical protein n=1 Tax=unclassified Conexibacter TaxID=2627773 RepID=UPI002717DCD7|nr:MULTISPECIES: hypothetical protein [unclassified Conexibacter]MDO8188823.1 hypothetical protein [Conexibacter sp. CPCC 205706]MDO8201165.1 hypothetical protein [Conexibacter sp. CPCC 205762]MDR9372741.1 hypothetical protein [Conexibacter sp. JD483]
MKRDGQRPQGRRSLLGGIGLALLALVAPGVATAEDRVTTFDGSPSLTEAVADARSAGATLTSTKQLTIR